MYSFSSRFIWRRRDSMTIINLWCLIFLSLQKSFRQQTSLGIVGRNNRWILLWLTEDITIIIIRRSQIYQKLFTSLMSCVTGLWPPPDPHWLSMCSPPIVIFSSTAARSSAALRDQKTKQAWFGGLGCDSATLTCISFVYMQVQLRFSCCVIPSSLKSQRVVFYS